MQDIKTGLRAYLLREQQQIDTVLKLVWASEVSLSVKNYAYSQLAAQSSALFGIELELNRLTRD